MIDPSTRSTSIRGVVRAPSDQIQLFEPPPDAIYTIEATAQLVDVPRRTILLYCKRRLVSPVPGAVDRGYYFDRDGIRSLRRIEILRTICGDNLAGIKIILDLTNELERLHYQMRFLSRDGGRNARARGAPGPKLVSAEDGEQSLSETKSKPKQWRK